MVKPARIFLGAFLLMLSSAVAFSADKMSGDGGADALFPGETRLMLQSSEAKEKSDVFSEGPTSGSRSSLEKTLFEENLGRQGLSRDLLEKEQALPEQKWRIPLAVEPGDGLAVLRWKVTGPDQRLRDASLKFTIQYGTEAGKYTNKVDLGPANEYKLRGLKNYQVYFVKVQVTAKDSSITISSDEERVVPLPSDELESSLEKSFSASTVTLHDKIATDPFKRELRQFGYDFFHNTVMHASPADNLPVGDDYLIGPGDSVRVNLWGSINARHELLVDRNGEILIPKVGAVNVWGLSYGQAKEAINRAISQYFKGYELNVTLGRLRTIQVYVVGEVASPGMYSVSSLGTVINALALAGGPSKNGSLRTIRLLKGGKVAQEIDLYDMFSSGDRSKDVRLANGDTIFVPVIGPVAAVAGEVKRPAIYEMKGNASLKQLLAMAGGITAAGYTGRVQVERFEGNSSRVTLDYELNAGAMDDKTAGVAMRDRDMVKVFPVNKALRRVVTLKGNVARPGEYQFREGMRLLDLIPGYEALQPETYLDSIKISRLALPDFHRETLAVNLGKALAGDQTENIALQEQDTVTVSARADMMEKPLVAISGEVLNPGIYDHYDNMRVRDLIAAAGSLKRNAYLDEAELTRIVIRGGIASSTRLEIDLNKALAGDLDQNVVLQPNDSLIVRGVPDWLEATDRFVTIRGEVKFPGTYSIAKGEKLSSVIARAGGFTEKAYLKGAKFLRRSVRENQQKRMDEVIARTELDILKKQGELTSLAASKEELEATKASLEGLLKGLDKLKTARAEGRVVIHLAHPDAFKDSPYDIEMSGGDTLEIPPTPNVVNVMGQVYNTTTLIHMPGRNLAYYLKKAGGPTRDAEEHDMYVIKADGSVESRQQATAGIRWNDETRSWTFGGFMSAPLDPGDTLVVPQKLERIAWMREIKDITTILSQVALTAGVIIAAGL